MPQREEQHSLASPEGFLARLAPGEALSRFGCLPWWWWDRSQRVYALLCHCLLFTQNGASKEKGKVLVQEHIPKVKVCMW
jgi:hypothetical protein